MARIQIMEDVGSEMVRIDVDDRCVFEGNFWDLPSTSGTGLSELLDKLQIDHDLSDYEYEC